MTSPTITSTHGSEGEPAWVQQHPSLWTGRREGRPIATIERGWRYTLIDNEGEVRGAFRTLAAAQNAAARL